MTRPSKSALVLDGNEVKLRLTAARTTTGRAVHVDWLRFTVRRRNAAAPSVDALFPPPGMAFDSWESAKRAQIGMVLSSLPDCDTDAAAQAHGLARDVCMYLGDEFKPNPEPKKGHDFYKHRISIERNGAEVGWVGFGASSDSPRQRAQAGTLHVNLYGQACTFARAGWTDDMADLIDQNKGTITRCDLALDFFDGYEGGIVRVRDDYKAGLMDVKGNRPKHNMLGQWADDNGHGRSFYIGSKEGGKQTNAYEKGDQLFGESAGSDWLRFELRYGNKLRVLETDMLRRPDDFFAGASEWHASVLREAGAQALPQPITVAPRVADKTVEAAVTRVCNWIANTAGPSVAFALSHMSFEQLCDLLGTTKVPGRLKPYSRAELQQATEAAVHRFHHTQGIGLAAA